MDTIISESTEPRNPGRPREFDAAAVLDKAIAVFSRDGYSATSITDLKSAIGLTAGSIYKAFGDKHGLFLAAFERYQDLRRQILDARLAGAATGRARVAAMLSTYADYSHGDAGRSGCLVVASAVERAASDPDLARRLATIFDGHERRLARFITEGQADGSIPARIDATATARLLLCVLQGMRVLGKTGRGQAEMAGVAQTAMTLLD